MMRAKMRVNEVRQFATQERIVAAPVCGKDPFGPNGESEDNTFARYTPSGLLELTINNPALLGQIKAGDTFYVDFTKVEAQ